MGKQLKMFAEPEPTADEKLNAAQAEMRLAQMERDATRPSYDQRRSRRKREVRARTISVKRITKRDLELGRLLNPEVEDVERPKTRDDCLDGGPNAERPCPFVSCKHHLALDVSKRTGAIKVNFPDLEVWEMNETCALDVASRGGQTLEEVGEIMNLTRERIRQVEVKGLAKSKAEIEMRGLRDLVDEGMVGKKRRLPLLEEHAEEREDEPEAESDEDSHFEADFDVDRFASGELDADE